MKQSDGSSTWGGAGSKKMQNSTNYYDTPKYVVDVLGGVVSKIYSRLSESRNHRKTKAPVYFSIDHMC